MIPPVALPIQAQARRHRRGFTLIELLTVIAIIGILAAIIIPVVGKVRTTAKRTQGLSNLRQVTVAGLTFAQDNKGRWFQSETENGVFYTDRLTAYVANTSGFSGRSELFRDPLLPPGQTDAHFAPPAFYFGEIAQWIPGLRKFHVLGNVKSPGKTVLFADNWVNKDNPEGYSGSWGSIQTTGAYNMWGYPGVWGDYTPNDADGNRVPGPDAGTSGGHIDLTRDPGQTKLGFLDGHVALVKREELYHRLFDPRFE